MKNLLSALSGIFSTIPGLAVIASGIGVPPSYQILFGGVIEALGVLALLILWVNREALRKESRRKITTWAVILGSTSLLLICLYIIAYNHCVVTVGDRALVYYPLWLTGEGAAQIARVGGRVAAVSYYGSGGVQAIVDTMGTALNVTTALLLFLYQAIFTSLTLAFGVAGFHIEKTV